MQVRPNAYPPSRGAVLPPGDKTKLQPAASSFPQEHSDIIHDTQFDYYGELLATASSDRTVGIHIARAGAPLNRVACLSGHEGPVWMVAWAHPRFGRILASASYDQRAILWKEEGQRWAPVHVITVHQGSVNSVCWAPDTTGPAVATASSDGTVAVTAYENGAWTESVKLSNNSNQIAHAMGATSVSFAPYYTGLPDGTLLLASGGCDCHVRLWLSRPAHEEGRAVNFDLHQAMKVHGDWVRDVAFSPASSASRHLVLATCGQDNTVVLMRKPWVQLEAEVQDGAEPCEWERSVMDFDEPVWRLSWAPSGDMLVVTTGNSEVFVLQEGEHFTEPWVKMPLSDFQ